MKIHFIHDHGFYKDGHFFCEVFGIPEHSDSYEELLNQGWLPATAAHDGYFIQSRSCRLNCSVDFLNAKRRYMLNKLHYTIDNFENGDANFYKDFYQKYCDERGFDIIKEYEANLNFKNLKVMNIYHQEKFVGFSLFIEYDHVTLFITCAYDLNHPKLSIGTNAYYLLMQYTRSVHKKYVYIYESYDDFFPHKMQLPNFEYFSNGWKSLSNSANDSLLLNQ